MDVLVFGGTTEGRELVSWLDARGTCNIVACAATEYGTTLMDCGARTTVVQGPLSPDQKLRLVCDHDFACIVDATHPYASHISQSIDELAAKTRLDVVRLAREDPAVGFEPNAWTCAASMEEAASAVECMNCNVLLTTGTKDLECFTVAIPDFADRLYVRILPVVPSLERALGLGIPVSHIVAMQGPFSKELNVALMRQLAIGALVTKRSGQAGGFEQKIRAAQECGVRVVVVERPYMWSGITLGEAKSVLEERYGL